MADSCSIQTPLDALAHSHKSDSNPCQKCHKLGGIHFVCRLNHTFCADCQQEQLAVSNESSSVPFIRDEPVTCAECNSQMMMITSEKNGENCLCSTVEAAAIPDLASLQGLVCSQQECTELQKVLLGHVKFLQAKLFDTVKEMKIMSEYLKRSVSDVGRLRADMAILAGGRQLVYFDYVELISSLQCEKVQKVFGLFSLKIVARFQYINKSLWLGLFVGLARDEHTPQRGPLKRNVTLAIHDSTGAVIEERQFKTFKNGQLVAPCFDSTRSTDDALWGFRDFIVAERILEKGTMIDSKTIAVSFKLAAVE